MFKVRIQHKTHNILHALIQHNLHFNDHSGTILKIISMILKTLKNHVLCL